MSHTKTRQEYLGWCFEEASSIIHGSFREEIETVGEEEKISCSFVITRNRGERSNEICFDYAEYWPSWVIFLHARNKRTHEIRRF